MNTFKNTMLYYCELRDNNKSNATLDYYYREYKKYYDKLGHKKIRALYYQRSELKKELKYITYYPKIKDELKLHINNTFISSQELKDIFNTIFTKYDIRKKAKGSLIQEYYNSTPTLKKIDKQVIRGYYIHNAK